MKELKWRRNKEEDCWELKVNNELIIELDNSYGVWSVWLIDTDSGSYTKVCDNYDYISDAKEKGLKIAKAIIEY